MALIDLINQSDLLVVGSGFFGLTVAERVANDLNLKVSLIDKRSHLGGNAYSFVDEASGIEVHKYGSHLFHTSNQKIWEYVNRFTNFNQYVHRVFSIHNGKIFSFPPNLHTVSQIYGRYFSPEEARILISKSRLELSGSEDNLENRAISMVGREIYDALIKGYTHKQWQVDPKLLPAETISRIPFRFTFDNRYFDDTHQGLPQNGYEAWFLKMIESKNINLFLEQDYFDFRDEVKVPTVYTGPVDKYFNFLEGKLSWRTLDFDLQRLEVEDFQGVSVMNYADLDVDFTRIHEFKHLHPERVYGPMTIISREYSRVAEVDDEPYYPINSLQDKAIMQKYREKIGLEEKRRIFFGGRLGTYKYLDMHMAIGSALNLYENKLKNLLVSG